GFDPIDHLERVFALPHDDDARHHVALAVPIRNSPADIRSEHDLAHVLHTDWDPTLTRGEHYAADLGRGFGVSASSYHVLGPAQLDQPSTYVVITAADRIHDFHDGDAVSLQLVRIDIDLILAHKTAERSDLGHPRDRAQLISQKP